MQQLISGSGSINKIASILSEKGIRHTLLVTGHHFIKEEAFKTLLAEPDISFKHLFSPDGLLQLDSIPRIDVAEAVVAIGGGKVMDFAKGIIHQWSKRPYFMAVPTTAGSGSEATPFAVFYSGKEKVSLDHPALLPQTVILDASLLKNLSSAQKAISGADAFSQCVESLWTVKADSESDAFAIKGAQMLYRQLSSFVHSTEETAAQEMLEAAHLSGQAIAATRTTGPHALSYYLTANHNVPHGQAVALFLPLFFLYNNEGEAEKRLQKIYEVLRVNSAEDAFEAVQHFFSSIGLATNFTDASLKNVDVEGLLYSVNQQRFANNPVSFDALRLNDLIRRYLC